MKKGIFGMLMTVTLVALLLSSCEASTNYSQLLKQEQELMDSYMARNGYEVLDEFPHDTVFLPHQFYRENDESIYIQIVDKGVGDTLRFGDQFTLRYKQSTLDEYPEEESYWDTMDRPYPYTMTMGDLTYSCEGWQEAFFVMKRHNSHAKIIVPSKLGRDLLEVVPYFYEMKINVIPK